MKTVHKRNENTAWNKKPKVECKRYIGNIRDWSYYWIDVTCKSCLKKKGRV